MTKNKKKIQQIDLSREQILDLSSVAGGKLGLLLALSPLKDEQKEALAEILEFVEPKQIDKLTEILESNYLETEGGNLKTRFEAELEKIKADLETKQAELENETLEKLNALNQKII